MHFKVPLVNIALKCSFPSGSNLSFHKNEGFGYFCEGLVPILIDDQAKAGRLVGMYSQQCLFLLQSLAPHQISRVYLIELPLLQEKILYSVSQLTSLMMKLWKIESTFLSIWEELEDWTPEFNLDRQ